jgi:PAS domain S-box-containing protein
MPKPSSEASSDLDLLNGLTEQLPGVLYRCALDEHWTMNYISSGIYGLSGYPQSDFLGNRVRSYASLIHPDDQTLVDESVRDALASQNAFDIEYRLIDANGKERWVHERGRTRLDEHGVPMFVDGVILETTKTHRLKQQLSAIIQHTPNVAIQSYTSDGTVLSWNPAAERLFGWTADQAIGRRLNEFLLSEDDFQFFLEGLRQIAAQGGASAPSEWSCERPDGGKAHCLATQFEIPSVEGGESVFICMDVDVGELHVAREALSRSNLELEARVDARSRELGQALEQLMESERLASLGRIVAGVAHELNTPIGNARTAASTLKDWIAAFQKKLDGDAPLRRSELQRFVQESLEVARLVERATEKAAEQITHFKQVAVDQQGNQRRDFSLRSTFADLRPALQLQFRGSPHRLDLGEVPDIRLDSYPGPLEQVLTILVQNALLHGLQDRTEGGVVQIECEQEADDMLLVYVTDNGMGIPESVRPKVFDPFFTTRLGQGGSGLGLHIAHNLASELLGGALELLPTDGSSAITRFCLRLPRTAPQTPGL